MMLPLDSRFFRTFQEWLPVFIQFKPPPWKDIALGTTFVQSWWLIVAAMPWHPWYIYIFRNYGGEILTGIHADILSDIVSDILFDILSGRTSGILIEL